MGDGRILDELNYQRSYVDSLTEQLLEVKDQLADKDEYITELESRITRLPFVSRDQSVYFAKLAQQAGRYDEMAYYMETVGKIEAELSVEERHLLSVAYKNTVGSRRAAWRIISSVEQKEITEGNNPKAGYAKMYRGKVEAELNKICGTISSVLDDELIPKATSGESKVFYQKMKADYWRSIAEFTEERSKALDSARSAYADAHLVAEKDLAVTHPIRLGLVLKRKANAQKLYADTLS